MPTGTGSRHSPIYLSDDDDDFIPVRRSRNDVEQSPHKPLPTRKRKLNPVAGPSKFPNAYSDSAQPSDTKKRKKHHKLLKTQKRIGRNERQANHKAEQEHLPPPQRPPPPYPDFIGDMPPSFPDDAFARMSMMMPPSFAFPMFPAFQYDAVRATNWAGVWPAPPPDNAPTDEPPPPPPPPPPPSRRTKQTVAPQKGAKRIIGLSSDRDPTGRRRTFKVTPTTVIDASPPIAGPYIPNAAHSLLMDQMPKSHRNPDYIRNWCRNVANCTPIFIAIEGTTASALIEFPSLSHAEKAWSSPKLGNPLEPIKKGAPREDLISVWWYLPAVPPAEFVVKELEDGEIEDEEAVKQASKEAKKKEAMKERIKKSKERQEAKQTVSPVHPTVPIIPPPAVRQPHIPLPIAPPHIIYEEILSSPPRMPVSTSSLPPPPPFLPPPPPPQDILRSSHHRAPLPPQSDLSRNWRPPNLPPKPQTAPIDEPVRPLPASSSPWEDCMVVDGPDYSASSSAISPPVSPVDRDIEMVPSSPLMATAPEPEVVPFSAVEMSDSTTSETVGSTPEAERCDGNAEHEAKDSLQPSEEPCSVPTLPSEPRAMKNPPKAPTYTKRSLISRQKELETRIARSKLELAIQSRAPTPSIPAPSLSAPSPPTQVSEDTATEERLRMMVLASKRKKPAVATPLTGPEVMNGTERTHSPQLEAQSTVSLISSTTVSKPTEVQTGSPPEPAMTVTQAQTRDLDLDELAVSFINEALQSAAKPVVSAKAQLAERQRLLEQQITETKMLMAKLANAKTKREKDMILASMKEKNRNVDEMSVPTRMQWPENRYNGILVVSDDEDEDEDD